MRPGSATPATATICVGDWLTTAAATPHSVTFVTSKPSHKFEPVIVTG